MLINNSETPTCYSSIHDRFSFVHKKKDKKKRKEKKVLMLTVDLSKQ